MCQDNLNNNWYVLYTRPRFERKVFSEIEVLKHECYLPMKTVVRKWSDRVKKTKEPIFCGYVFIYTDLRFKIQFLQIPGVVRFVSTTGKPEKISINEINRIKLIENGGSDIQVEDYYTSGDRVRIIQGVFAGMEGVLIQKVNRHPRFLIRLPLLKQAISVDISVEDLLKV